MFWNDIKEIKDWMDRLTDRLCRIDENVVFIKRKMTDFETSIEDEFSSINRIHDKLDFLVEDENRITSLGIATKTLDKFDDYMKNVDKLNAMVNEFKGCVSMARGALQQKKESEEGIQSEVEFKIDAIYKAVCELKEQKIS